MKRLDNDMLPVYKGSIRRVDQKHPLYRMCYSLSRGEKAYFIIDDTRYLCSRNVRTYFSKYCKEYDKTVKYYKFDGSKWSRGDWKNPHLLWNYERWIKSEDEWVVPFSIRFIDKCIRNFYCFGYGDGIKVYHKGEVMEERYDPQREHSRKRKRKLKLTGSDNFLDDM